MATLKASVDTFTTAQLIWLDSIANLCPYQAGDAVYIARTLYSIADNTVAYDDADICETIGISSKKEDEVAQKPTPETANTPIEVVRLYPNPAKDMVYLNYLGHTKRKTLFELTDMLGRIVKSVIVNADENLKEIRTENMITGVYLWRLKDDKRLIKSGKLVIAK